MNIAAVSLRNALAALRRRGAHATAAAVTGLRGASSVPAKTSPDEEPGKPKFWALENSIAEARGDVGTFQRFADPVPQVATPWDALAYVPDVKVTTLPNGLRVATSTTPHAKTATVGVWLDAGSRFESDEDNGAAHFLEHMAFKGTAKRTARSLEQEVENMGGHLNAYTSREQTTYFAKVLGAHAGEALDMLSDIIQNPTLSEPAIERERNVILREMEEVEGMPEEVVFDHLHATAFQHCTLGRTILGPAANIRSMSRAHLEDYIKTHYTAPRTVVAAAGDVNHDEMVELASKLFTLPEGSPPGATSAHFVTQSPARFTGSEVRIRDPDMPKLHFALAFEGLPWTDADAVPLMVAQQILGGWDKRKGAMNAGSGSIHGSSRLGSRVAENQLADHVAAFNTHYADTGLFGVYAVCDPAKADDLAWCLSYEITALCYEVEPDDVQRAKNVLMASHLCGLAGSSNAAEDIGRQLLTYGRVMPKRELIARLEQVTVDDVKQVANRLIYDQDMAIAAMGDTTVLPDYNWFRRRTYWLRY